MPAAVTDPSAVVDAVRAGSRRAAARLISRVEAADETARTVLRALYAQGCGTPVIGITGPPGAGKSTLVDQLIACWRARGETVAVLAVDPSSPISGGAILGDRVRMNRHNADPDVFIRSMSARGHLGGLSSATGDALIVLDAMGFDHILIETVGTGQSEIDILHHAQTVIVVQTPVGGDAVQAMKSGLLEIADIFVVNKSDAPGADRVLSALREIVEERAQAGDGWPVPIVKTQATSGTGVPELDAAIAAHQTFLNAHPAQRTARARARARALLLERLAEQLRLRHGGTPSHDSHFEQRLDDIVARRCDPGSVAAQILEALR